MLVSIGSLHCKKLLFFSLWQISILRGDAETMQISFFFFCSIFCPLILAPILLVTRTVVFAWWWFYSFLIPCAFIGILLCRRDILSSSFIFISINPCICFSLWVIIQYGHICFIAQTDLGLAFRSSIRLTPVSFQHALICFHACLWLLVPKGVPGSFCIFRAPVVENYFFEGILAPFIGE